MKVLLSSIAKNDIRLLVRVFNAEKESKKGNDFLEKLQKSIDGILQVQNQETKSGEISVWPMLDFPVNIHYIFEDEENLLITAVFKN
ncbi:MULTISPECIES: hypothetical protein [Chryseobacterium]|uniref:Type II toxin-antitoxin system RelE/ParE family toxin n=1 Tax=Chryseobacterium endophyticum TaxID=1854762 RepID=A0AAU6WNY8_9FLAO|nr:hypothetical protein [uncultured Chryseobacterium sp.]